MSDEVQRFRMTFKCSCGRVFKKLTTDPNLEAAPCPECKKKDKKTKLFKIGDGPVPASETKADHFAESKPKVFPNTIYKCNSCFNITKIFEEIGDKSLDVCPACDSTEIVFRGKISKDISSDSKIKNQAVDYTADVVMTDYKMSDLNDRARPGESMAPKLATGLQNAADNFFSGAKKANKSMGALNPAVLAKKAMSGDFSNTRSYVDPVKGIQPQHSKLNNVQYVAGDGIGKRQ